MLSFTFWKSFVHVNKYFSIFNRNLDKVAPWYVIHSRLITGAMERSLIKLSVGGLKASLGSSQGGKKSDLISLQEKMFTDVGMWGAIGELILTNTEIISICISLVVNQAFRNFDTSHKCHTGRAEPLPCCCCRILVMQLSGGRVAFKLITKVELKEKIYSAGCCLYFPQIVVDILILQPTEIILIVRYYSIYTLFLGFTFPSR